MLYTAFGSSEFCSWSAAADRGGATPENPIPGESRIYNVDAWLDLKDASPIKVSGIWLSELPRAAQKQLLKELGLPVTKTLVYIDDDKKQKPISDLYVADVWDGWCNLKIKAVDDSIPDWRIHSMCLADMNSSSNNTEANKTSGSHQDAVKITLSHNMPSDVIVFDIEATGTNYQKAEICELAALKVVGGTVVDEFSSLVYIDGSMPKAAESVHHISKDMLEDAPHMRAALNAFLDFLGNDQILVGHNIQTYDIPFIKRIANLCGRELRYMGYADTLSLARQAWPEMKHHRMEDLRLKLGLTGSGAHRALKDCQDELAVYLAVKEAAACSVPKPKKKPSSSRRPSYTNKWNRRKAKEFSPNVESFDMKNPIFGKRIVFSGDVEGYDYDSCMQKVCDLGGTPQDNVTQKTDYLVLGNNPGKGKLRKVRELKDKGIEVAVIDQSEFKSYVGWCC